MKRRMTEILSDDSIGSSGETITKELPSYFMTTMLGITMVGANTTDAATLAEILAGFGEIEISTRNGTPIKFDADDLYYFNRDILGHVPFVANTDEAIVDNYIRELTLFVPLNPKGIWDPSMGLTPDSKGKCRVVLGSDTVAGMDGRAVSITAMGVEGANPATYMGMYMDSFTSGLGDNFRDVQSDRVQAMLGAYLFTTTGREDLTTTDAPGCKKMGHAVSKSVREKVKADVLQALISQEAYTQVSVSHAACSATSAAYASETAIPQSAHAIKELTDYIMLDYGLHDGVGLPYVDDLQVFVEAGVAEAMRVYPMLTIRNG